MKIIFIGIILILFSGPCSFAETRDKTITWISIADIHFDPFLECYAHHRCQLIKQLQETPYQAWEKVFRLMGKGKLSTYYHDCNYALLQASLAEFERMNQKEDPAFVLMLGDFLAHHFHDKYVRFSQDRSAASYRAFVKKTIQFLTYELQKTFPHKNIYPVLGNDDTYQKDYYVEPRGAFLKDTTSIWSVLIQDHKNRELFKKTFPEEGYYEDNLPRIKGQKIIVLNSVLFTDRVHYKAQQPAAWRELHWLHERLLSAKAAHQSVLIVMHIPIGIDVLATIQNKFNLKDFWQKAYREQFENELRQFSSVIIAILPAHIHMETYQWVVLKQLSDIPVVFTPSISPIFGNDPGFKVFFYDEHTLRFKKIETYFLPLQTISSQWLQRA